MDKGYNTLLNSYKRVFGMVDAIHFNSQNTAEVYMAHINVPKDSDVVTITHKGISDHRRIKSFDGKTLRLGFIGSEAPYKGLPMLKNVLARLNSEGCSDKVHLSVYGGRIGVDNEIPNIENKGKFTIRQMESVYDSLDLLVVPSIWYETFSLITIEAIQYGVPVLVSNRVGAKDIVKQYMPRFIFDGEAGLYLILKKNVLDRDDLIKYNKRIVEKPWQWSINDHTKEIEKLYRRL